MPARSPSPPTRRARRTPAAVPCPACRRAPACRRTSSGGGGVEPPGRGVAVGLALGALAGCQPRRLEPRMARQQANELLPDHPGGAKDADFDRLLRRSIHCAHDASITPVTKVRVKKKPADRLLGQRVRVVRLSPDVRSWLLHLQRTHIHHRPAESLDPLSADGFARREHSAECRRFDCEASRGFACRYVRATAGVFPVEVGRMNLNLEPLNP